MTLTSQACQAGWHALSTGPLYPGDGELLLLSPKDFPKGSLGDGTTITGHSTKYVLFGPHWLPLGLPHLQ